MISIIVPVYKVEKYLPQCLDSILAQTYRDLEILLIDDGSPDKSGKICDEYARLDKRIRVIHTENMGVSEARNLGIREVKGEYIGFVDSDDWIEPNMYEYLLHKLEEEKTDIVECDLWYEYLNFNRVRNRLKDGVISPVDAIYLLSCRNLSNFLYDKLYKRECWDGIVFPKGRSTYEDVATVYKVILNSQRIACTTNPLYHYRMRNNSIIHARSMKHFIDRWNAYYSRYQSLSSIPAIAKEQRITEQLKKELLSIGTNIVLRTYDIPPKERDHRFLCEISNFEKKNFPLLGEKEWRLSTRIESLCTRYANDITIIALHFFRNRGKQRQTEGKQEKKYYS